ncbi:prepilin-type N-terminal cleavage/methylation domain-containing protein [Cerasicoccus frondis]|uniref:prepilin-type N-terminal cleavage/methylation domain-containing protein n=1 Tax=Cerasicoccus frondis TaxID=490090 RepID=UPI002852511D|nr:prepilin-type N-terminal cleavage/methylation domain-containing protein [Cerasicoccus frondis]
MKVKSLNTRKHAAGFTLLELLVVVAILAAVAGTASIALKDTDARASAAAHVAMMDELNKGVHTYRVLTRNSFPNQFDSLMELGTDTTDAVRAGSTATSGDELLGWDAGDADAAFALNADAVGVLGDAGITDLMYIDTAGDPADDGDCSDVNDLIASRGNAVVSNNIFMTPDANGCGSIEALVDGSVVTVWTGGNERLTGQEDPAGDGSAYNADGNPVYLMVGVGPSSTLFNTGELGGMTTVPVYRHVGPTQYGRFIAIFEIGTWDSAEADGYEVIDQIEFITVVDGALDTKEEELGEWDGTRNTI